MNLHDYFENTQGRGVLATYDAQGIVDVAVYARPHFLEEDVCVFLMTDRRSHKNLQDNPHAAYLFKEDGTGYKGKRLFLTRIREEKDSELLYSIRSKRYSSEKEDGKPRFLVFFKVDRVLPLIGPGEEPERVA